MGAEAMRAFFVFSEAKKLGKEGLYLLEVLLANLYEECKSKTFQQRRQWVADQRMQVIKSARNPMSCSWWRLSQKPYQTLAACIELHRAWNLPDPKLYQTSLPIRIDVTGNCLQHLAALARDEQHAEIVKIASMPDKTCGDVYDAVASSLALDTERDTIKKAVVTFFSGASTARIGALLPSQEPGLGRQSAVQITCKHNSLFKSEKYVQNWLTDCARRIMNGRRADRDFQRAALVRISPLGLPIVQPYNELKLMAVRTPL